MESHHPSKRRANAVAEEAEDRLSALPDDLLHSLKDAVRTSALSRRWPRLWLGALAASPVLDFSDHAFARGHGAPLPPPPRGAPLDAFRSRAGGFRWDVVAWTAAAVARGARKVELDLTPTRWRRAVDDGWGVDAEGSDLFLEFPADMFRAANSLARLALVRCSLRAVPADAPWLAGLRSFSLSHADIADWPLRDVLVSLRSLEFLSLRSCNALLHVKVVGERLRRLELVRCLDVVEVRVVAPALESFAFHGDIVCAGGTDHVAVDFGATPALRDAYLSHLGFSCFDEGPIYHGDFAYCAFLNRVAHATVLTVSSVNLQHIDATRAAALTLDMTELQYEPLPLGNMHMDLNRELTMDVPNLQELQLLESDLSAC